MGVGRGTHVFTSPGAASELGRDEILEVFRVGSLVIDDGGAEFGGLVLMTIELVGKGIEEAVPCICNGIGP